MMNERIKVDFEKMGGLVPTIIQEENGTVLSLVYSNEESLKKSIETNKVWRFSRAQKKVLMKGAASKNVQEIIKVAGDCDSDALLFTVKQKGAAACHTGAYSCFGEEKKQGLPELYEKICTIKNSSSKESYTAKLFSDEALLKKKLIEEAAEVILAKNKEELVWECADLLYFLFVIMAKSGVTLGDIALENKRRDAKGSAKRNEERAKKVDGV
ncbi:Phosphoribosyl-AMP cyclohydrolase [uncultured archaeon]|nr:Phosphoribosyl-AMP cyclohydrolase [uncultured archaeon]